jgi:predicted TIM-barrel fold metal-dependent hydrolase
MRIDIHSHFQSIAYVKHLRGRGELPRSVLDAGMYVIQCAAGVSVPALPSMLDMEQKLADMDVLGVDLALLSHGIPLGPDALGGQEADDWACRINDDLARIVADHPGRFAGLGTLGFGNTERSISEVNRCIHELGFKGMQIFSNVAGQSVDSPKVLPVLKHIGLLGVPIHLHPAVPLNRVALDTASLMLSLGFPFDSSLSTVRLIRSGLLDQVPDLRLIVAHAGGVIPYLRGRIATYSTRSSLVIDSPDLLHPIERYLDNLYVDTVCYDPAALEYCYNAVGAGRMLYATDHPFGAPGVAAGLVEQVPCTLAERDLIYHGNAEQLFHLS